MFGFGMSNAANYGMGVVMSFENRGKREMQQTSRDAQSMQRNFKDLDKSAKSLFGGWQAGLKNWAIGAGFAFSAYKMATYSRESQQQWKDLESVGVGSMDLIKGQYSEFIRDMGTLGAKSPSKELRQELKNLASAGVPAEDLITALKRVDTVAVAGQGSVEQAAQTFTDFYQLWNKWMPGSADEKFAQWASAVTAVQQINKLWLPELSSQMATAGASFATQRVPYNEFASMIGVMAGAGLREQAGTSARAIMENIAGAQKKLNLKFIETEGPRKGMMRPILEVLDQVRGKYGDLIDAVESDELTKAFDQRGAKGIKTLVLMYDKLKKTIDATKEIGRDERVAAIRTDTFNYAVEKLKNNWGLLNGTMGSQSLPILTKWVNKLAEGEATLSRMTEKHPAIGTGIVGGKTLFAAIFGGAGAIQIGTWAARQWKPLLGKLWSWIPKPPVKEIFGSISKWLFVPGWGAKTHVFFERTLGKLPGMAFKWGKLTGQAFAKGFLMPALIIKQFLWDLPKTVMEEWKRNRILGERPPGYKTFGGLGPTELKPGKDKDWMEKIFDITGLNLVQDIVGIGQWGKNKLTPDELTDKARLAKMFPTSSDEELTDIILGKRKGYNRMPATQELPPGPVATTSTTTQQASQGTVIHEQNNEFVIKGSDPESIAKEVARILGGEFNRVNIRAGHAVNKPAMASGTL